MTIRHVVAWKLAAEDAEIRAEHAAEVARRIRGLFGVVPSIRSLSIGPNSAYADVNGDVALVADFDDVAGLEEYQVHPAHQEVAAFVRGVVASRISVDFEV
ncbi:Dabb family protein [Microbacterium paludicola]|uniref:Dabb family protein n=1 Tax=Microbacterium paludicola TaxID=300019 RepID=UPI00090388D9|nr:Dabb family protein [Microbacterium paludicola]APF33994.1 stress responsive alpha-beta barrel domain-containing protein [Microbacterium paludicola]